MSNWYEQATKRLANEAGQVKGSKEMAMRDAVREALLEICRQNEEFAQAVVQGRPFPECMSAVARGVGNSVSDLEAYRRAVSFYFDGAQIDFSMTVRLEPADTAQDQGSGIVLNLSDFF